MKGDRYTTFGAIPLHTVFRYVPDHAKLGPRVKVDAHLCCTPAWYEAHEGNPSQDALTEASWKPNSGVYCAEENMRVRVTLADNNDGVPAPAPVVPVPVPESVWGATFHVLEERRWFNLEDIKARRFGGSES